MATTLPKPAPEPKRPARRTPTSRPALPHDRDESVDMTGGVPSEHMRRAARDVERGVEDTTRAPEADRAYRRLKDQGAGR